MKDNRHDSQLRGIPEVELMYLAVRGLKQERLELFKRMLYHRDGKKVHCRQYYQEGKEMALRFRELDQTINRMEGK